LLLLLANFNPQKLDFKRPTGAGMLFSPTSIYLLIASLLITPASPQAIWHDQRYTAHFPHRTNHPNGAIESSRTFGLGEYRRPAEAISIGGAAAQRQASDRLLAAPTLFEVTGSGLDGRTVEGLTINGQQLRNNIDLSSSSFRSEGYSPFLSGKAGAGRLNSSVPWIPAQHTPYEFVEVTFPSATLISHISTRGGGVYGAWVESFRVSTSIDGINWKWYKLGGDPSADPHLFVANTDEETIVRHQLFGEFLIESLHGSGGKSQLRHLAPLLVRRFRIYPTTWNATLLADVKIAMRFDLLRRVECGDGVWDEMNEGCEDGNVIHGDGCSGITGDWRGTQGPCEPELETKRMEYNKKTTHWCHPSALGC